MTSNEDTPSLEEMKAWNPLWLAWRALFLALMCADRKPPRKPDGDPSYMYADKELRKMAPVVNERFGDANNK